MASEPETMSWYHIVSSDLEADNLQQLVDTYPKLIDALSAEKKSAKHSETLAVLDDYRYDELPGKVASRVGGEDDHKHGSIELEELKRLLEWKMSRGVFRPMLRGLIASNTSDVVKKTTGEAFSHFANGITQKVEAIVNVIAALKILCKLKGVGPATASLILSVAYPLDVPFFGDELFAWLSLKSSADLKTFRQKLHAQGTKDESKKMRVDKIVGAKYTESEYKTLYRTVFEIRQRLKTNADEVSATDIERAAFVVLQGDLAPLEVPGHVKHTSASNIKDVESASKSKSEQTKRKSTNAGTSEPSKGTHDKRQRATRSSTKPDKEADPPKRRKTTRS